MRAVNLMPDAPRTRRERPSAIGALAGGRAVPAALAVGALALLCGLGYAGPSARADADRLQREVTATEVRRDALRAQLDDFRLEAQRQELQRARRGAIVSLVTGRTDWERLIRDVATVVPPGVWLTGLTSDAGPAPAADPATPAAGASPRVTIEGMARTQGSVATMMARAGSVAGLGRPRLVSSGFEDAEGRRMVRFVIEAAVDQRAQGRAQLVPVAAAGGGRP